METKGKRVEGKPERERSQTQTQSQERGNVRTVAPRFPQAMAFHPETSMNLSQDMPYTVNPTWPASAIKRATR